MIKTCRWCARIGRLCVWPYQVLLWIINLLFLPDDVREWIFGSGTRALELINALMLLGWAAVMLVDASHVYLIPSYAKFAEMPQGLVFGLFAGVGALLLVLLPSETPRSNVLSGFLLVGSALLWSVVSVGFWYTYPPLNTAMVVYPVLAASSWWAGVLLIDNAKDELFKPEKARGG